jgi:hypothetical protein
LKNLGGTAPQGGSTIKPTSNSNVTHNFKQRLFRQLQVLGDGVTDWEPVPEDCLQVTFKFCAIEFCASSHEMFSKNFIGEAKVLTSSVDLVVHQLLDQ